MVIEAREEDDEVHVQGYTSQWNNVSTRQRQFAGLIHSLVSAGHNRKSIKTACS